MVDKIIYLLKHYRLKSQYIIAMAKDSFHSKSKRNIVKPIINFIKINVRIFKKGSFLTCLKVNILFIYKKSL